MSWNYRVVEEEFENEPYYYIKEVYYDKDGNPELLTEDPVQLDGESVKEIMDDLKLIMKAFQKPILNYDNKNERFINK